MNFSRTVIAWYLDNKRDLPWRNTKNPYFIWLSEVILQQTRVAQGMNYYLKFIANYPTIKQLADAPQDDVLKLWQGLGYYSRARNLHTAAKQIVNDFNGNFPKNYQEIISLKGVGEYTAAAIASFAYNEAHAVVDGNVYRVLARYFGIETPINSTKAKKQFYELANKLIDKKNPGLFNQAIMEFGALQCVPSNPDCSVCPLLISCEAYSSKRVKDLPIKEKKTKVTKRYFTYLIIRNGDNTFLQQRSAGDIWQGLYEFPLIETDAEIGIDDLVENDFFKAMLPSKKHVINSISNTIKHVLSHQHIYCRFINIDITEISKKSLLNSYQKNRLTDLEKFAIPRLIDRYLHN